MEAFVKLTILGYAAEQVNGAQQLLLAALQHHQTLTAGWCTSGRLAADLQAGVQDASIFPLWRLNVGMTLDNSSLRRHACLTSFAPSGLSIQLGSWHGAPQHLEPTAADSCSP